MDCSEVCRMNVVRLNSVFTSVSTYSTNTTSYKKKYIKDNNIDQERFWLITDVLMMNDLEDLKRVHNLANYLMAKRIKDNAKVAEA